MTATYTTKMAFTGICAFVIAIAALTSVVSLSPQYAKADEVTGTLSAGTPASSDSGGGSSGQTTTATSPGQQSVNGTLSAGVGPADQSAGSSLSGSVSGGVAPGGGGGSSEGSGGESFGGNSPVYYGTAHATNSAAHGTGSSSRGHGDIAENPAYPNAPATGGMLGSADGSTSSALSPNPKDLTAAAADAGLSGPEWAVAIILGIIVLIGLIGYSVVTASGSPRS